MFARAVRAARQRRIRGQERLAVIEQHGRVAIVRLIICVTPKLHFVARTRLQVLETQRDRLTAILAVGTAREQAPVCGVVTNGTRKKVRQRLTHSITPIPTGKHLDIIVKPGLVRILILMPRRETLPARIERRPIVEVTKISISHDAVRGDVLLNVRDRLGRLPDNAAPSYWQCGASNSQTPPRRQNRTPQPKRKEISKHTKSPSIISLQYMPKKTSSLYQMGCDCGMLTPMRCL